MPASDKVTIDLDVDASALHQAIQDLPEDVLDRLAAKIAAHRRVSAAAFGAVLWLLVASLLVVGFLLAVLLGR